MAPLHSDKELINTIHNFFQKSTLLICSSKDGNDQIIFDQIQQFEDDNLKFENILKLPETIEEWFHSESEKVLPPLVIETLLDLRKLSPINWITLSDDDGNTWSVCKGTKKSEIVLERWLIELDDKSTTFQSYRSSKDDLIEIRKQIQLLARYLYTLIQLLPSNELESKLSKIGNNSMISINKRVIDGSKPILSKGRIGLNKPIISSYSNIINESNIPPHLEQRKITPVWTKYGLLRISVSYRHDCRFEQHHSTDFSVNLSSNVNISSDANQNLLGVANKHYNRSLSVSPHSNSVSASSSEQNSYQRRHSISSRPIQPFKVGSVGNTTLNQSQAIMRTASNSSVIATLRAQRSRNDSISGSIPSQDIPIESTSVGSGSRYSSSFGRIRRHSSIKSSETLERPIKPIKHSITPSDDLLDFVKMMDEKQELNISKSSSKGNNMDISNSILRFQKLKPSNDLLSENLSGSISIDPTAGVPRRSSVSHSRLPSISPPIEYPLISSRLSKTNINEQDYGKIMGVSRRNSLEGSKPNIFQPKSVEIFEGRIPTFSHESIQYIQNNNNNKSDELLMSTSGLPGTSYKHSTSPHSIDSVSSMISKTRIPFQQPSYYSHPTTSAIPAYAKLHRPSILSTEMLVEQNGSKSGFNVIDSTLAHITSTNTNIAGNDSASNNNDDNDNNKNNVKVDDEEELLFFMSDMNLSKR